MKWKNINLILLLFVVFVVQNIHGQYSSFYEIRENLLNENPQSGNLNIRYNCFGNIDDLLFDNFPPLHPDTKWFFIKMLEKAILEIKTEQVTEGATVWQIYNHGFIIKTPSITFGIDLHDYFHTKQFLELAELIDVYFITHEHTDHYSNALISSMQLLNKKVVGPAEFTGIPIKMSVGESRDVDGLWVIAHDGLHGNIPLRQYEIITSDGIKILHTGDNQTTETLPQISDVDILLLNSWINESGSVSWIEGVRYAIDKIKPKLTLPGHMVELSHLGEQYPPVPYRDPIASDDGSLVSEYCILGWGEKYHIGYSNIDYTRPNIVHNLDAVVYRDSILVTWEDSAAPDGDSVIFYRVIIDNRIDTLLTARKIIYPIDTLRTFNFKVLSYDDWGNQSLDYSEIEFETTNETNYPPRILNIFPHNEDTISTFEGVISLFNIKAIDLNGDDLNYKWILDDKIDLNCFKAWYEFQIAHLEPGLHSISALIFDQQDSIINSWLINYHKDLAIIDNEDSVMYTDYGNWETSILQKAYGISCRTSGINNVGDYAHYKYSPQRDGIYDIYQITLKTKYASNNVLFEILSDNLVKDSVNINQNIDSGDWIKLGSYKFNKNSEVGVKIINNGLATSGYSIVSDAIKFIYVGDLSEINDFTLQIPGSYSLSQNYPNPFNPITVISYSLPSSVKGETLPTGRQEANVKNVMLKIYDLAGREIATLVDKNQKPGYYEVEFDGKGLTSGIYFYRLQVYMPGRAGNFVETKKMILLR